MQLAANANKTSTHRSHPQLHSLYQSPVSAAGHRLLSSLIVRGSASLLLPAAAYAARSKMASASYAYVRQVTQPTAVDLTLSGSWTDPKHRNLVLVRYSNLDLYTFRHTATATHDAAAQLSLVRSHTLFGNPLAACAVRLPSYQRDSLLLAFADCKVALLHYSPATHDWYTLDTAYYEHLKDQLPLSARPSLSPYPAPLLRVDPLQRCAVLVAYASWLVVFPLVDTPELAEDADFAVHPHIHTSPGSVLRSFNVALSTVAAVDLSQAPLSCPVDVQFLSGYNAPTLLLLYQHPYTWEGRYAAVRHSSRLVSLTLDLPAASFLILARTATALPFDSHCLVPLPAPYGGCLVISPHLLFHINSQQHIDYTLSTNLFGDIDRQFHSEQSALVVDVQVAASTLLPTSQQHPSMVQVILALRDGQSMLLTLETAGSGVRGLNLRRLYNGSVVSAMCVVARDGLYSWLFIGSRAGVSLLVELRERSDDEQLEQARVLQFEEDERDREREERETERKRLLKADEDDLFGSLLDDNKQRTVENDDDGYDDIFGLSLSNTKEREVQRRLERTRAKEESSRLYELTVCDAMPSISPCVDFVLLSPDAQPTSEEQPRGLQTDVVAISGSGSQGTLSIQQDGVLPSLITRFALDQRCTGCWTVRAPERRKKPTKRKRDDPNDSANPQYDTDLFVASPSDTTHLHVLEAITQVEASASYLRSNVRSLLVGNVCGWLGVVQVWSDGVRLVWRGERTLDKTVVELTQHEESNDEIEEQKETQKRPPLSVVRARLCDPYIALGLSDGGLHILRVDEVERKEERSDHPDPFILTTIPVILQSLPSLPPTASVPVTAFAMYNHSGHDDVFVAESRQRARRVDMDGVNVKVESDAVVMEEEAKAAPAADEEDVDDLDLLLAGGEATKTTDNAGNGVATQQEFIKDGVKREATDASEPTRSNYVCVVCRLHYVEVYALPSFGLLFRCHRFSAARQTLIDAVDEQSSTNIHAVSDENLPTITDITLERISDRHSSLPVLLAYTAHNDLLIYQAYSYQSAASSTALLRFTRFHHGLITRPLSTTRTGRLLQPSAPSSATTSGGWLYGERFVVFPSLSGHACVLVAGFRPLLLFNQRDRLQLHDLLLDRRVDTEESEGDFEGDDEAVGEDSEQRLRRLHNGVACATSFHNVQCQHGAVYVDVAGYVHIAELPVSPPLPSLTASAASTAVTLVSSDSTAFTHFDYSFPIRIHPLASTPRFLSYHTPTSSFAVILCRPTPIQSIEEVTHRSLTLTEDTYELLLLSSPATAAASNVQPFSVIGRFDDFEAHEAVLCMATVTLADKTYVAIGTAIQQGEETAVKGRILLLEPYSATSSSTAAPLLKLRVFVQAEKGPVTSVSCLSSLLVAGIGMRVMLYEYDGKALVGRGFLDIEHDIVSVRVLKYYILLADVYASVVLACWDPICKQVMVLGRWREAAELTAVEWLVEGKQLSAVVAELSGAVSVLRWIPRTLPPPPPLPRDINNATAQSLTDFFATVHSQRMQVKGELHVGSGVTRMEKFRMRERGRKHASAAMAFPALSRAKSGSVGAGSGPVPLLPEVGLTGRPHEQERQPFNLATNTPPLLSPASLPSAPPSVRSALLIAGLHGSLAVMHPLDDLQYRRLHSLASQVHSHVPMVAALNARQWGSVQRRSGRTGGASRRGIVDGGLLRVWLGLDVDQQLLLCRMIGMQVEQVYDILLLNEHNTQLHV